MDISNLFQSRNWRRKLGRERRAIEYVLPSTLTSGDIEEKEKIETSYKAKQEFKKGSSVELFKDVANGLYTSEEPPVTIYERLLEMFA